MTGLTLAAAASIAVGLSIGAAATVGVTLSVEDHAMPPAPSSPRNPAGPYLVQYGDRCADGQCAPCDAKENCPGKLSLKLRP
jgi:uncharacterized protein DUF2613